MEKLIRLVLERFKSMLIERIPVREVILFGSRARGDAAAYSDVDVVVITENELSDQEIDFVSDCAWNAGFEHGTVIVPIVFSKNEWENSPERSSLLAKAVEMEGVSI